MRKDVLALAVLHSLFLHASLYSALLPIRLYPLPLVNKLHRQRTYNVTFKSVRETIVAVEKQYVLDTGFMFLRLFNQHAMRMRRITLSSVASLALPYSSTLPHKQRDFLGGKSY